MLVYLLDKTMFPPILPTVSEQCSRGRPPPPNPRPAPPARQIAPCDEARGGVEAREVFYEWRHRGGALSLLAGQAIHPRGGVLMCRICLALVHSSAARQKLAVILMRTGPLDGLLDWGINNLLLADTILNCY